MPVIGRTRHRYGILETVEQPTLGTFLREGDHDPDAPIIPDDMRKALMLPQDFPRISAESWAPFRDLCLDFVCWDRSPTTPVDTTSEVAIIWIRHGPGLTLWDAWAPKQQVNGGIVDSDLTPGNPLVCLRTGDVEEGGLAGVLNLYNEDSVTYPGPAYHGGSAHSHNLMGVGFSSRDDGAELGVPGVHCILGRVRKVKARNALGHFLGHDTLDYNVGPSITMDKRRFQKIVTPTGVRAMTGDDLIHRTECDQLYPYDPESPRYHPNVLTSGLITRKTTTDTYHGNRTVVVGGLGLTPSGNDLRGLIGFQLRTEPKDGYIWAHTNSNTLRLLRVCDLPKELKDVAEGMIRTDYKEVMFPETYDGPGPKVTKGHTTSKKGGDRLSRRSKGGHSPKVRLFRNGRAEDDETAEYLADLLEATLMADPEDVPLSAWNRIHDAITASGYFDPAEHVDPDDPTQEPRQCDRISSDDLEIEWVEGTEPPVDHPVPPEEWEGAVGLLSSDPGDPEDVRAAIDAHNDMANEGKRFVLADDPA